MTKTTTVASDSSIIERMSQGDPLAVRELRKRHSGSIYALAYMLVGHTEGAEQVEAETFRRAQRTSGGFDARRLSAFRWLSGIARRAAKTHMV